MPAGQRLAEPRGVPSFAAIAFACAVGTLATSFVVLLVVLVAALNRVSGPSHAAAAPGALSAAAARDGAAAEPSPPTDEAGAVAPTGYDAALLRVLVVAGGPDAEDFSVVVLRPSDGRAVSWNPGREYYAASFFKLAVLYELDRQVRAGLIDPNSALELTEEDRAENLGTIDDVLPGDSPTVLSIADAARAMVTLSDNASAVALLHLLTGASVDDTLALVGLRATSVNTTDLPTTAADMGLLMRAILEAPESGGIAMRELLLDQRTREGIPSGLPEHVAVGNKTGTWADATHDVAFVEAPSGTYIIAILSDHDWDWPAIRRISAAVYAELEAD